MGLQKVSDTLGFMSRQIVGNDVYFSTSRLVRHDIGKEGHELFASMTSRSPANDLSGGRVEGGIKGKSPVPIVFKSMALGSTWREWKHRIETIKGLNSGLLIDTKHSGMLGRMDIKTNDVGGLGFEIGIVGGHIALQTMRSQTRALPYPSHRHSWNAQMSGQLTHAPMSRPVWRLSTGPCQNASFQFRSS